MDLTLYNVTTQGYIIYEIDDVEYVVITAERIIIPLIIVLVLVANIALISRHVYVIRKKQYSNKTFHVMAINLGISNILFALLFTLVTYLYLDAGLGYVLAGNIEVCKTVFYLSYFSGFLNCYSVIALLVTTLVGKVKKLGPKEVFLSICITWIFCGMLAIPRVIGYQISIDAYVEVGYCHVLLNFTNNLHRDMYQWMIFTFSCGCPLVVAIILGIILWFSKKEETRLRPRCNLHEMTSTDPSEDSLIERVEHQSTSAKHTRICTIAAFLFALMWMPFFIGWILLEAFFDDPYKNIPEIYLAVFWAKFIGVSNAVFIPLLLLK